MSGLSSAAFPALPAAVRGKWCPVYLSPIFGSSERLVIGIAVVSQTGAHLPRANALHRLECLYGDRADIVQYVAAGVLAALENDIAARSIEALTDFDPPVTGASVGALRAGEGQSLEDIGRSWLSSLSSLHDADEAGQGAEDDVLRSYLQLNDGPGSGVDRLPKLVLEYVNEQQPEVAPLFRADLRGAPRRRRSHEVTIDFAGSTLVANFGTMQGGQLAPSVGVIKRRLWDLKVQRDSERRELVSRRHEMLVQVPAPNDPQLSERQYENLVIARDALEQQADQEELRFESFTTVAEIGRRILQAEVRGRIV